MTKPEGMVWDRHAINAEVRRRGMTLTGIAIDAGLYASACRQGIIGNSRAGAEAIAKALDIPFRTLFPSSYTRGQHTERQTNRNGSGDGSPIHSAPTDKSTAAS